MSSYLPPGITQSMIDVHFGNDDKGKCSMCNQPISIKEQNDEGVCHKCMWGEDDD
tara:strand:+ start:144 stop:308 length:165 start_codon:yes stop_codon:yes gene_type:complete